ncbi:MAG TPA: tRNA lysidine(34) synthetase TilS, partial [Porticoccaceae bacterium]|nr:tRNA lysidine(34) synthetase TilS [Porticoccaceae bacterium]
SGGLDSHVLLHGVAQLLGGDRLSAIHVNHQLSPQARHWEEHCRVVCGALGVEFICSVVDVPDRASQENAAREARYRVFEARLGDGDLLLMAHHADDQAETILYRLMRRSGPRGLAGMPRSRSLGEGRLLRPLLALDKKNLEAYAEDHKLSWVEDDSNRFQQFDRNFLRHEIITRLASRWPNYAARIADAGVLCGQADQLNRDLAALDLQTLTMRQERRGWSIEIAPLTALGRIRQANVLRYLAMGRGLAPPGHRVIDEVLDHLLSASAGRNPQVRWPGGQWRRYRQRLYLLHLENRITGPGNTAGADPRLSWKPAEALLLPDGAKLEAEPSLGQGLKVELADNLRVGFRQGGERCRPAGRAGSASLKKLFQEYDLEPWLRGRVPLIYAGDELAAVGDLWVSEGFQASPGEGGWRLTWNYPDE